MDEVSQHFILGGNNQSVCSPSSSNLPGGSPNFYRCSTLLGISGFLLSLAITELAYNAKKTSISGLWNLGFGTPSSTALIKFWENGGGGSNLSAVLLANCPQIPVSVAYFLYNNVLTTMLLAAEYDGYAQQRKSLRVSWPKGHQRSTYYLTLPYRYSFPLMVAHTLLHWLISQSLFYVQVLPFDARGNPVPEEQLVACGFSPIAIIFSMSLGGLMVCTILGVGMKRYKTNIPLAVSCSAAISAACHPPPGGGDPLKPIKWGEIPEQPARSDSRTSSGEAETGEEEIALPSLSSLRPESSLDIGRYHELSNVDGQSSLTPHPSRQGQESHASQVQLLTGENACSDGGEQSEGHCSFSSLDVMTPSLEHPYA